MNRRLPGGGPNIVAPAPWTQGANAGRPLTAEELMSVASISTVVRYKKGEKIYQEGNRANAVFNIITGVVKSYRTLPETSRHIVGFLFCADLLGLAEAGKYVNSAEAVTAVTAYKIPTNLLETRLREEPGLDFQVISKLCHELREAQRHASLLGRKHAVAKVGLFLQMLGTHQTSSESSGEMYLPMTRQDIGAYLGISPETVSRSLRELVFRGAITCKDRRHIQIVDPAQLNAAIAIPD
jgi:CRP-like cAMP-binding protein